MSAHAAYQLRFHLVWGAKARHRVLEGPAVTAVRDSLLQMAEDLSVTLLALHVEPVHVHALVSL
jgi:REP element-mobilizing transposase RayT